MKYNFTDEKFMTANEKTRVMHDWIRFLKSGCARRQFTEILYHHLIQHCSFIAHYNRAGFYETYFTTPEWTARFLRQFDARTECKSVEYSGTYWKQGSYIDINEEMINSGAEYITVLLDSISKGAFR